MMANTKWKNEKLSLEERYNDIYREWEIASLNGRSIMIEGLESAMDYLKKSIKKLDDMTTIQKIFYKG
jgi:hypothetical protein